MANQQITDIHCHILPGLDDGPRENEESIALLRKLKGLETDRVFCTSHFLSPHFEVSAEAMDDAFERLSPSIGQAGVELKKGAELRVTSGMVPLIQNGTIPTLGDSRYVLVEFRSDMIAERSLELIHELIVRDYLPIMAHPERNIGIQKNPGLLEDLLRAGLLFQLTAWCFDKSPREMHAADKLAWKILEDGMATVIASDAHNTTTRPPGLIKAYDNIASKLGQGVTDKLIHNANAIWVNMPCLPVEIPKSPRRSLKTLLFK